MKKIKENVKNIHICPTCGNSEKWYAHRMDYSKVKVLKQIAKINQKHTWVKIQQDSALIKDDEADFTIQTDAVHASRLHWYGLLDKKSPREGLVKINQNGLDFLSGKLKIPSKIWVCKGQFKGSEDPWINISQVKGFVLDKKYWDNYSRDVRPA